MNRDKEEEEEEEEETNKVTQAHQIIPNVINY
jgi:hypothetical protein